MKSFIVFVVDALCRVFTRGDDASAQKWSQKILGSWYLL